MSKLVEREPAPGAKSLSATPALAVQFFLIPLAVVGMVVLVYGGFRMLLTNERTPEEFLSDVQTGGRERRWPAPQFFGVLATAKAESGCRCRIGGGRRIGGRRPRR